MKSNLLLTIAVLLSSSLQAQNLALPKGFHTAIVTKDIPGARSLAISAGGWLYVGTKDNGKVYALNLKKPSATPRMIAESLNQPNGVAIDSKGTLYVAEIHRIRAYDKIDEQMKRAEKPASREIAVQLPSEKWHGWRYMKVGPDNQLYVGIGVPCNVCEVKDPHGTIIKIDPATGKFDVIARGIRNTVGFDWHPKTRDLWFSDNGRDELGDDTPPEEINRVSKVGEHFGFPGCFGKSVKDPKFGNETSCSSTSAPILEIQAHSAVLGVHFYSGTQFPQAYRGRLFLAEHGSWNRSKKVGYKISTVDITNPASPTYAPFATGWLQNEKVAGRPVDFAQESDGSLLFSDDLDGKIYRITYVSL